MKLNEITGIIRRSYIHLYNHYVDAALTIYDQMAHEYNKHESSDPEQANRDWHREWERIAAKIPKVEYYDMAEFLEYQDEIPDVLSYTLYYWKHSPHADEFLSAFHNAHTVGYQFWIRRSGMPLTSL